MCLCLLKQIIVVRKHVYNDISSQLTETILLLCSRGERLHDNSFLCKIRENVDDLYKWQTFQRTSLHQCQGLTPPELQ